MHDLLHQLVQASGPAETISTGSHDIVVALIITAGTVVSGALALVVASVQRDRHSSRLNPEQREQARRAAAQDRLVQQMITDLNREKEAAETECEAVRSLYNKLRDAVFRRGLDPDQLIRETA